ncbi:hypothetical protein [Enterovirga aerilata]|uniref:Lipoprotein n=1 Tax=Enterovirga aerilata TaxID=2730920 RepID=A0A849I6M0_9HYPH|nr:hypothetical protein [Enterovirga sp. DB1703]NNM72951.1 hypothetical protein [Enterovirga sp. DB1703]
MRLVPALAIAAALAGCAPEFPPIAAGLAGDHAFKARIARNHGPGTSAVRLREELIREGFTIVSDPATRLNTALFRPQNLPCYSQTRIDWQEDRRGRITRIQAQRHDCT